MATVRMSRLHHAAGDSMGPDSSNMRCWKPWTWQAWPLVLLMLLLPCCSPSSTLRTPGRKYEVQGRAAAAEANAAAPTGSMHPAVVRQHVVNRANEDRPAAVPHISSAAADRGGPAEHASAGREGSGSLQRPAITSLPRATAAVGWMHSSLGSGGSGSQPSSRSTEGTVAGSAHAMGGESLGPRARPDSFPADETEEHGDGTAASAAHEGGPATSGRSLQQQAAAAPPPPPGCCYVRVTLSTSSRALSRTQDCQLLRALLAPYYSIWPSFATGAHSDMDACPWVVPPSFLSCSIGPLHIDDVVLRSSTHTALGMHSIRDLLHMHILPYCCANLPIPD